MSLLRPREVDFEALWARLEPLVREAVADGGDRGRCSSDAWVALYSDVYRCCSHPTSPKHERLFERLRALFSELSAEACAAVGAAADPLGAYCEAFERYRAGTRWAAGLFSYLDRYWVAEHGAGGAVSLPGVFPVAELALHLWRAEAYDALQHPLCAALLAEVRAARDADAPTPRPEALARFVQSCSVLGEAVDPQHALALLRESVEAPFVNATAAYWRARGEAAAAAEARDYMHSVARWAADDRARCEAFLLESSAARVAAAVETALVDPHADRLVGLAGPLLAAGDVAGLRQLHALLQLCSEPAPLVALQEALRAHVLAEGRALLLLLPQDSPPPPPPPPPGALAPPLGALLELHVRHRALLAEAFEGQVRFASALDKAFGAFVNEVPGVAVLLAQQLHALLDQFGVEGGLPEPRRIEGVRGLLTLFRFVDDKDVFRRSYWRLLARRLVEDSVASAEAEELVLTELRALCGWEFTAKMLRMFADRELSARYRGWGAADGEFEFSVLAMSAGQWPISAPPPMTLPAPLGARLASFEAFHAEAFPRRTLSWIYAISSGELRARGFGRRDYRVRANAVQMAVLLCFNAATEIPLVDLAARLGVEEQALMPQLRSVVGAKLLLLPPDAPGVVRLNAAFKSKLVLVNVPGASSGAAAPAVEAAGGAAPVAEADAATLQEDRRLLLQACIVRLMKTRGVAQYGALELAVVEQLQPMFRPTPALIRENVERLVEREFIRRGAGAASEELTYVA